MINLKYDSDAPTIGLETEREPQGYFYVTNTVFVERSELAEILQRARILNETVKDVSQLISDYMEYGVLTVTAYIPDGPYREDFTSLTLQYPSYAHDDGSIEWINTKIPIDGGEIGDIRDKLTKQMKCESRIDMANKVKSLMKSNLEHTAYDLHSRDMVVYKTKAETTDEISHLHCDFYLHKRAAAEILVKTEYLKTSTDYYASAFKSIQRYEENGDNNVRILFGADLYEDGKGTLTICQHDIKAQYKWETANGHLATAEDLPKFIKYIQTFPLKDTEISAVKTAINQYHERSSLSLTADDILENIKKANDETREAAAEGPINKKMTIDKPYIVRTEQNTFIEAPLSFTDKEFDVLLERQPLTYEDGTVIHNTAELKSDTWIWAFAQIDKNNKAVIEMQIDGIFQSQGNPEILTLSDKETKALINVIEEKCKEDGYSLDYLKSHMEHKNNITIKE